jgi:hypothetical protein
LPGISSCWTFVSVSRLSENPSSLYISCDHGSWGWMLSHHPSCALGSISSPFSNWRQEGQGKLRAIFFLFLLWLYIPKIKWKKRDPVFTCSCPFRIQFNVFCQPWHFPIEFSTFWIVAFLILW